MTKVWFNSSAQIWHAMFRGREAGATWLSKGAAQAWVDLCVSLDRWMA
jgi:hypothetical protein